ncbi:hypothetical protein HYC85_014759 [Camellia sinensis]|uniref:Uncharacterized protein n=1 Tax=Camellia sinensis TaxID=4442 RepID=A0A7J7H754_CAMSI|nr:hypothetical protein HYC85_014759 [Camellia sinensis]
MVDRDKQWDFHLRTLSASARDSNFADPVSDPSLLNSVKKLHELCKAEKSEDLIARVYPQLNKIFQRSVASISQSRTSSGLLLLEILQFFIDFGEVVLHDADPNPVVAEATLDFLNLNKRKLLMNFPALLPQIRKILSNILIPQKRIYNEAQDMPKASLEESKTCLACRTFKPLTGRLGKSEFQQLAFYCRYVFASQILRAWCQEKIEKLIGMSTYHVPDPRTGTIHVPVLVVALEKVERSSGSLIGNSIASLQKSTAPEMLLALMDEAYTGSTIGDGGADSESDDSNTMAVADPLFLELLKDENDGLAERHWTSSGMAAAMQSTISAPQSDRLKQALKMTPRLLDVYFAIAVRDVNDCYDKQGLNNVQKRLLEFMLAAFHRSPDFVALLKKPIIDRLGEAYDSPCKGRRLGLRESALSSGSMTFRKSSQSRLLCFVVTAIAKLATHHRELLPRARVSLAKVARSRISDVRVWRRARDYLGLMNEPAICLSVLGPSRPSYVCKQSPGTVNWNEGASKMTADIPFYILGEHQGAAATVISGLFFGVLSAFGLFYGVLSTFGQ